MKKIYNNRMKHAVVFGDTMLLPGANVAEEIDAKKFPQLEVLIDGGDIVVEKDTAKAVKDANTQKAVDEIVKQSGGDEKTKAAANKRKKQLDKMDDDAKKAIAEAEKDGDKGEGGAE